MEFNTIIESILQDDARKVYRVKWYHYGKDISIDDKTTAASEEQAKTFVYSKNKNGKLRYIKFSDFRPKITEVTSK